MSKSHENAYCRCILHVAAKNSDECNRTKNWGTAGCYNPYAVCRRVKGEQPSSCGTYNWDATPANEIRAYAELKKLDVPANADKSQLVGAVMEHKAKKYGQ